MKYFKSIICYHSDFFFCKKYKHLLKMFFLKISQNFEIMEIFWKIRIKKRKPTKMGKLNNRKKKIKKLMGRPSSLTRLVHV